MLKLVYESSVQRDLNTVNWVRCILRFWHVCLDDLCDHIAAEGRKRAEKKLMSCGISGMNTHTDKPDIIYTLIQLLRLFTQEVNKSQISLDFFIQHRFFAILRPM